MTKHNNILINKPQINISYSSRVRMWLVSFCSFLCIVQSAYNDNGQTLILAAASLSAALIAELLLTWNLYRADKIKDGSAVVTALVLSLLLPNQIHPVYAALGAVFAIVVVKYSFGGLGTNWLNPAVGGWLFIRFSWTSVFLDAVEKGSVSINEINVSSNFGELDNSITEFLNNSIFSVTGINLPSGYIGLLFNNNSSVIADRGLLFLLIGTIIITAAKINRGWIPFVFLSVYGFLIRFAGDFSGLFWNGDILYGFFSGGAIAAAFILAAEPASGVRTNLGMLFTVAAAAVLSWLFRYRLNEYSGCFAAVAMINCFSPIIRLIEDRLFLSDKSRVKIRENVI